MDRWTCRKCGSTERRTKGKGCAECHRIAAREQTVRKTAQRALERDTFEDIVITPAARNYLNAFTAYLEACKAGDLKAKRKAKVARQSALEALEGSVIGAVN